MTLLPIIDILDIDGVFPKCKYF